MYARRLSTTLVTASDGSVTGYVDVDFGVLSQIRYVKTDFADTVDFAITAEATGENLWTEQNVTASATRAPRQATHSVAGVASEFGTGFAVTDKIAIANDRIKIAITNGGSAKTGTFHFVLL